MSPPGKKSGRTTKASVVNAIRGASIRAPLKADRRLIFQRRQDAVVEGRYEEPLDKVRGQAPAAAVAEQDVVI